VRTINEYGHLPLHLAAATATSDNTECVRILLDAHPDALWQRDHEGDVPLQCAVGNDTVTPEFVGCLLVAPPKDADTSGYQHPTENSETGQLPLHFACVSGASAKVLDQLIDYHPEALFHHDNEGNLPLHVALRNNAPVSNVQKLHCAASKHKATKEQHTRYGNAHPKSTTTTMLPSTLEGMPALFVACVAAANTDDNEPRPEEEAKALDVIRFLAEHSPDLFKL
jgi:ankyrin repeat protein